MPALEIPFAIGETVWCSEPASTRERLPCPDCDGAKTVKMLLGNGEVYTLPCRGCQVGCDPSRGYVEVVTWSYEPRKFTPRRVDMSCGEFHYSAASPEATCFGYVDTSKMFHDKAECEADCERRAKEAQEGEDQRMFWNLKSKRKDMAWSVHYWRSQAIKFRKELAWVEARLHVSKEKKADAARGGTDADA